MDGGEKETRGEVMLYADTTDDFDSESALNYGIFQCKSNKNRRQGPHSLLSSHLLDLSLRLVVSTSIPYEALER